MVTPLKRKIDASPSADSPTLSRLAKRMARSSMSTPPMRDLSQLRDDFGDGAAYVDAIEGENWEEDRWGDDALFAWEQDPTPLSPVDQVLGIVHQKRSGQGQHQATGMSDPDCTMRSSDSEAPLSRTVSQRGKKKAVVKSVEEAGMNEMPIDAPISSQQHKQNLLDRGMPDYATWNLPDLQGAVAVFGLKPSKIAKTMIKQLQQCWEATHPEKPVKGKGKGRAKAVTKTTASRKKKVAVEAESSEEENLASQVEGTKKTATKKKAVAKKDKPVPLTVEQLNAEFEKIILEPDLYIRVLRYEPLYFESLVTMGTERGISDTGWKNVFKKYLDDQSITYYVEEPTGRRRRR
ncbi:hypothetical protein QFC19_003923 [Naganishia cerealis]|uniref:Uncharacterized protein n=1 Tax=Naganishia cerealis TaxID=610337 RepID=A0ACC2VZL1_9TREE|nr:hypothetical protein QFC19_003923 [Naganishia cerealis]